jgi:hypothetical protein
VFFNRIDHERTVGLTVVTNGDEVPTVGPKERDLVNEIGSPRKFRIAVARRAQIADPYSSCRPKCS